MKYILGRKIGMTQRFLDDGRAVPVTAVEAGPCHVTQVRDAEKDGYTAVQIGFGVSKNLTKSEKGHLKEMPAYSNLKEFPQKEQELKKGDELLVTQFAVGDKVDVTGTSKGKGFQGVVKRHGFLGSQKTHGNKDQLRMPGSIGSTGPARVFKNMRMAGHMGDETVTVKDLEVIDVLPKENIIYIKGAIPGPTTGIVSLFSLSTTEATYETAKPEEPVAEEKKDAETPASQKKSEVKPEEKPAEQKETTEEAQETETQQEEKK